MTTDTSKLQDYIIRQTFTIEVLQELQSADDTEVTVESVILGIGLFCDASSVNIFENTKDMMFVNNTYEWCADGITSMKEIFQNMPYEYFPLSYEKFRKEKILCFNSLDELPSEMASIFPRYEHESMLFACIEHGNKNIGFLNINRYNGQKWEQDDIDFIRNLTGILATTFVRRNIEKNLKNSETKFRTIVQQLSDLLIISDAQGLINYVSPSAIRILGYKPDEMTGKHVTDFVYPDDREHVLDIINEKRFENIPIDVMPDIISFRAVASDGRIVNIEGTGRNALEYEGINGIIMSFRDISLQLEAEEKILKAKEEAEIAQKNAEVADKLKSAFLANMSHEIRSPMNGIVGFSTLIQKEANSPKIAKYARLVNDNCKMLLQLIDDIIDISKIEAGQLKMSPQLSRVNHLLDNGLMLFHELQKKRNNDKVEIILDDNGLDEVIMIDPIRLTQVITNLISNAIKFTDKGYICYGYMREDEDHLLFYVKDTGIGIPENEIDAIFGRFRQVDDHLKRNIGGTGIGLSISQSLVEMMGGRIWVESVVDEGTNFYFTIAG